jgi:hypothetical protein
MGVDRTAKRGKIRFDPYQSGIAERYPMTLFVKRFFPMGFVPVLLGTMMIVGCSRLPWSKSEDKKETLPEGKTVYIDDLEQSKGINKPDRPDEEPQKAPAQEAKPETTQRPKGKEQEGTRKIARTPLPPADVTFSPVKSLATLKRKISILDLEEKTGLQGEKYGELAALRLYGELERTHKAVLVDKEVLSETLASAGIEPEDLLKPHAMKEAHQLLGIQAFITVSVSDIHVTSSPPVGDSGVKSSMATLRLELRLIDASTGNLLRAFIGRNPSFTSVSTGLHSHHRSVVKALDYNIAQVTDGLFRYLDFLEWSSTVARVENGKVYIHAGRLTGLRVGAILEVYEPGEEIINPITKFSLGWTTGQRKGKVVVTSLFGVDASVAEPLNGAGFSANDIVKTPQQ